MNWNLAVEKNHEALQRILAMLVAMIGIAGNDHPGTLPRHLHRFVLRLLRPAESATRRLIIVAARGLVVKLPKFYERGPRPKKPPLNRKNGYGTNILIRPGPLPEWAKALVPKRSLRLSLSLLDPMKRFGVRRKYAKRSAMPQIRLLNDDGPIVPFFRKPEPLPPPAPTPDDLLDAASIHRRLDVLARALDDLPKQAMRMARWQARRDARLGREREASKPEKSPVETTPSQPSITAQTAKPRRFHRISPMRPGRPPGWRRKPNHDVYEVLNELHGLAVWASERRDTS